MVARLSGWLRAHRLARAVVMMGLAGILVLGGGLGVIVLSPELAAQASDALRNVIGDEAVAQLETFVFQVQDTFHGIQYQLHPQAPAAPWAVATPAPVGPAEAASQAVQPAHPAPAGAPAAAAHPGVAALAALPAATATSTAAWMPAPLAPMGTMQGEGMWTPYLTAADGQVLAYRAFLQPDPTRPYVVVAVVAFDLNATRLHLVLGTQEPASSVQVARTGRMAAQDAQAGVLLAAFNGGFKARHGHFGIMVDGTTVLPPRDGLGTVAIYQDGRVAIGAWGTSIAATPEMVAWRQNGPLIIQDGVVNPHTADVAPQDWGYTVNGVAVTWRSALGISADGRTLYYMAGQSLTLPVLASAMADTGAAQAMQLDINNYWVHFESFTAGANGALAANPLLPAMGNSQNSRFLNGDTRDYFYVTTAR